MKAAGARDHAVSTTQRKTFSIKTSEKDTTSG